MIALRWAGGLIVALALGLAAAPARADCPDGEVAREAFVEAQRLAAERRLAAAREAYARSLAACPRVPTAYNLAVVELQLGAFAAALDRAERLAEAELGPLSEGQAAAVEQVRDEAQRRVAFLDVTVAGASDAAVRLDGRSVGAAPLALTVDPGVHRLEAEAADGRRTSSQVEASAGRLAVSLRLPAAGQPLEQSPWLWTSVILVAIAAVVVPITVVELTRPSPIEDEFWGRAGLDVTP